jgi:hypothetical protein
MTATIAQTAAPPYAVPFWIDANYLFCELPSQNGPCVFKFTRDTIGLAKAFATVFAIYESEGHGEIYATPQCPSSIPDKNGITDRQRQEARDILRKLKVI